MTCNKTHMKNVQCLFYLNGHNIIFLQLKSVLRQRMPHSFDGDTLQRFLPQEVEKTRSLPRRPSQNYVNTVLQD
jgi:hypothetical protein